MKFKNHNNDYFMNGGIIVVVGKRLFQVIGENKIRQTRDNDSFGTLVKWVSEIAGKEEAVNVQGWSEICEDGEYYEGKNFEIICLGW